MRGCTVPAAKDLAGALNLEVFLDVFRCLVVEKAVGVLLPTQNFELQTESRCRYVAGFVFPFIKSKFKHSATAQSTFKSKISQNGVKPVIKRGQT
jgi:hypothetical protein